LNRVGLNCVYLVVCVIETRRTGTHSVLQPQRLIDPDLRIVDHAGRGDQADDERAVEHWRQSDGDDLTGRDRMLSPLIVAISALPRRADIGGAVDQVRFVPGAVVD